MEIKEHKITIRELSKGYHDGGEEGVVAYGGKLDVRPPYQREFVYDQKKRDAVIRSVRKEFPLNTMYWAVRDDGNYEIIDGQQRTISICRYINGDFSVDGLGFESLQEDQMEQILNYKLMIYLCQGRPSDKLAWFEIINMGGEVLTKQELLNAIFPGPWTSDAKRHFSKNGCPAYCLGEKYMQGSAIRQDYLETVIEWKSDGKIKEFMGKHHLEKNASALWQYFQKVIAWAKATYPDYRREMKSVQWGTLYNKFKDTEYDTNELAKQVTKLMMDDDVQKKPGIYAYVLDGDERHLNIRQFSDNMKREAYERQKGQCHKCKKKFPIEDMHADHIKPWSKGGKTNAANCRLLCRKDNLEKADEY